MLLTENPPVHHAAVYGHPVHSQRTFTSAFVRVRENVAGSDGAGRSGAFLFPSSHLQIGRVHAFRLLGRRRWSRLRPP